MTQMAKVVKNENGKLLAVMYRQGVPNNILDEIVFAKTGEILPERPRNWQAWILDNFPPIELFGQRFSLSDGKMDGFYEVRAFPFLEEGMLINLSDGRVDGHIHGEYIIETIIGIDHIICAERVGPVDETKFLHLAVYTVYIE